MEQAEGYSGSTRVRSIRVRTDEGDAKPNTFGHAAQDVGKDARQRGQAVVGKVAEEAQNVALRIRGEATGALNEGKTQLATQIGGVARALQASSREFRNDDLRGLADISESLAEQISAVEHYLGEQSGESLLEDIRTFANRHRSLFVGSLFVAGIIAVRFAQSTPSSTLSTPQTTTSGTPPARSSTAASAPRSRAPKATVVRKRRVSTYRTDRS